MDDEPTTPAPDERPAPTDAGRRLSATELRDALDGVATEFVLFVSATGKVLSSNRVNTMGWDAQAQQGTHIAEHLHPDDLLTVFDVIERARATRGFADRIRVRARHADGSWRVFDCIVQDARAAHPDLEGAVIRARDVTEELAEAAERVEDSRFVSLSEAVPLGILSAGARGWVVFSNEAACRLFDMEAAALHGEGWRRAVMPDDRADVDVACEAVVTTGRPTEVTFRLGTGLFVRWVHARFVPLGDQDQPTGWIATVDDVTERRRAESRLAHLATHDSLTKLPNRSLLEDRLRQACHRLRRDHTALSVLFVDLDGFKAVNDTHGHATGDRALVEVARRLRHVVREVDTVARLGGDEFVVVCEGLADEEAREIARRIEEAVAEQMIAAGAVLSMGASVGVVECTDPDANVADLLNRADQAMYRVKQAHRTA